MENYLSYHFLKLCVLCVLARDIFHFEHALIINALFPYLEPFKILQARGYE